MARAIVPECLQAGSIPSGQATLLETFSKLVVAHNYSGSGNIVIEGSEGVCPSHKAAANSTPQVNANVIRKGRWLDTGSEKKFFSEIIGFSSLILFPLRLWTKWPAPGLRRISISFLLQSGCRSMALQTA